MTKKSLLDEIRSVQEKKGAECSVKILLDKLPPGDRDAIEEAFRDPAIFGTSIAKVLKGRGFDVAGHTIQRHRRGGCTCATKAA